MSSSSVSDKLVDLIKLSTTQAITSVQNLDLKNKKLELALQVETNTLARNLQHVVYELRKLLANHYGNTTVNDHKLINSANSLAKIVNDLQATLTTDVTNIKTQLPILLAKLPQEADNLSDFVKNSSDKNDNTKVIDILETFLTGVFCIQTRSNVEQLDKTELRKKLNGFKQRQLDALQAINSNDEKTYNELIHLGRLGVKRMKDIVQALEDDAQFFQGTAGKVLYEVAEIVGDAMNYFERTIHTSPDAQILATETLICTHRVYRQLDTLLQIFEDASNDFEICDRLNNTILSGISHTFASGNEYTQGIADVGSRQK